MLYKLDNSQQDSARNTDAFDQPPTSEHQRISEELVLYYTDCKRLSDVQVVALRDRNLALGLDVLSACTSL